MATFGPRALGLLLVLALCFATWTTGASSHAALSGNENDAQRTPYQLRVKPNDTLTKLGPLERDSLKNDHRQLFLITSIISNLFGLEDKKKSDAGSSSSAGSTIPTPTPTSAPTPATPKPNATLSPTAKSNATAKPTRDPLGKISW